MTSNKYLSRSVIFVALLLVSIRGVAFEENQVVTARHVNSVQEKQAKSIKQGVKLGKLTPKEARKLRKEQYEINDLEREMRANGSLNAEELGILFERLEKSRKHINKLLRNNISTHEALDILDSEAGSGN